MSRATRGFTDRFWDKVADGAVDACWPWLAARYRDDYGLVGIRNQGRATTMRAHALALTLFTGEDAGGRYALHRCDNPPCCNPSHLYWGDQKRNIADMHERGRANPPERAGSKNPRAVLSEVDVAALREAYAAGGITQAELAERYGVTQPVISLAIRRLTWKTVA